MAQNTPRLVSPPFGDYFANTGNQDSLNIVPRGSRYISYGGAQYCLYFQSGYTTSYSIRVTKSTDRWLTRSILDQTNEPEPNTLTAGNHSTCVVQGSKFRLLIDHETLSGSTRTYETRIYTFDCSTELWEAGYVAGKSSSVISGTGYQLLDACLRGDEILVLYNYPASVQEYSYIDIYDTGSASWTTQDIPVFDGTGSFIRQDGDAIIWDGTYTHIFSGISNTSTGGVALSRLHVTMDASNALGSEQNILLATDPTWVNPVLTPADPDWFEYKGSYQYPLYPVIHDGKVYAAQSANISAFTDDGISGATWYRNRSEVICWVANAGESAPTWSAEAIVQDAVNVAYAPALFVSGGTLTCVYSRDNIDYDDPGRLNYSTRDGSWSGDAEFYNWTDNPPDGLLSAPGTGGFKVTYPVPVPDVSGGFAVIATLNYAFTESAWYLSQSDCCCANFAY